MATFCHVIIVNSFYFIQLLAICNTFYRLYHNAKKYTNLSGTLLEHSNLTIDKKGVLGQSESRPETNGSVKHQF